MDGSGGSITERAWHDGHVSGYRVAIVHEWLATFAGSERVLAELLDLFPDAILYCVVDFLPESERGFLQGREIRTSFVQKLPLARRLFRNYLPLMPLAMEQLDLSGFDLVISSHHSVAKGVITGPDQLHICYVHSPMRYAWDMQAQYLRQSGIETGLRGLVARCLLASLRTWDVRTANGVDVFVANSSYIARRVRKVYQRDAEVVYPPVDLEQFAGSYERGDYYLVLSRQTPYKRVDLIAEAFRSMPHRKLVIAGGGPVCPRVAGWASGASNITVLGAVSQERLPALLGSAKALVVAAEEDFGITMVEAQASGTPLIAFGRGGAVDILDPGAGAGSTGVLFFSQSAAAIQRAVEDFETSPTLFHPEICRSNAKRFSRLAFRRRFMGVLDRAGKVLETV